MLDICGITESMMPKLYESYDVTGTLLPEMADKLGLSTSVKIVAGAGDNAAAAIGTGTVGNGSCNISLGTSGTLFISSDRFLEPSDGIHSFAHADGAYHLMGCMLSAASCNKWFMDQIIRTTDYPAEQKDITDDKLGKNHVYYLPYLMGERAPHNDPFCRSCFIGMTMDTTREDMTQAVLEGVAFGIRDSLEEIKGLGIEVKTSMVSGGGMKSPLWQKIFANVLDITLTIPETEQGPGYGGAILAAVACGEYSSVQEACDKLIRTTGEVKPDPELAADYDKRYQTFHKLYPALKDIFPEL
jgi:xylulokinase